MGFFAFKCILTYFTDMHDQKLSLSGNAELISKMAADYAKIASAGQTQLSANRIYIVKDDAESGAIVRSARKKALQTLAQPIVKNALDSRRIDQEETRSPRRGLQYYHRSDEFVSEDLQRKLNTFSRLMTVLDNIKDNYGKENAWHDSYARELYNHTERALRLKVADGDYHEPQLAFLEQLIYARYRLSMEEIDRMDKVLLKKAILKKDEDLEKRGVYIEHTGGLEKESTGPLVIDSNNSKGSTQQNLVEAIFGNNNFRRDGERKVERTITIKITDNVIE